MTPLIHALLTIHLSAPPEPVANLSECPGIDPGLYCGWMLGDDLPQQTLFMCYTGIVMEWWPCKYGCERFEDRGRCVIPPEFRDDLP